MSGAIDVLAYSIGASNTATYGSGSSGTQATAGVVNCGNLTVTKVQDPTSNFLWSYCVSGAVIASVVLLYDQPVGGVQTPNFRIYLDDAIVTNFQSSGSTEVPTETISFAYQAIEIAYKAQNDDGKSLAGAVAKGFSVATNSSNWAAPSPFS